MPIHFKRFILSNGLRVIIHEDSTTPLGACNIVYNVGSRDENPNRTGMAHLFEHFMFTGSKNIPNYDRELQKVGAINNAYTSQDVTHYYITFPAENIETALWLESDRMNELSFQQEQLDIQKNVVIEEFKESFLNKPYGDLWLLFNDFVFERHPYKWLPIGKEISHIANVNMDEMKSFFYHFYRPNNAVLTLSGNFEAEKVIRLVEKWFADIPSGDVVSKIFPQEPIQNQGKLLQVVKDVPHDMLMKGWLMCNRNHADFYAFDLLSDLFGSGQSSYLYQKFVTEDQIFSDLSACITATADPGIWIILGRPAEGISIEKADELLSQFLYGFSYGDTLTHNLQKVKNRVESILLANEIKIEERSSILALSECAGGVELFENDRERYFDVSEEQIRRITTQLFNPDKANTLYYKAK